MSDIMKSYVQKTSPKPHRKGKIIPNGVKLEPHEYETILFFTELGKDVELIPPSLTPGVHNADFFMDKLIWEAKCPTGNSTRMTIDRILHKAARQSENIVIDLRRTKLVDEQSIKQIEKRFELSRRIRRLLVITKQEELIDLRK